MEIVVAAILSIAIVVLVFYLVCRFVRRWIKRACLFVIPLFMATLFGLVLLAPPAVPDARLIAQLHAMSGIVFDDKIRIFHREVNGYPPLLPQGSATIDAFFRVSARDAKKHFSALSAIKSSPQDASLHDLLFEGPPPLPAPIDAYDFSQCRYQLNNAMRATGNQHVDPAAIIHSQKFEYKLKAKSKYVDHGLGDWQFGWGLGYWGYVKGTDIVFFCLFLS